MHYLVQELLTGASLCDMVSTERSKTLDEWLLHAAAHRGLHVSGAGGRPADRRTDIFALGCILYEMIGARRPFEGRSAAEVIARVLDDDPPALESVRAGVPSEISRIVHKCLAREPGRRYQHADDLALDLREAASQPEPRRGVPTPAVTARRGLATGWWLAIVTTAVVAAIVVSSQLSGTSGGSLGPVVRFEVPADPNFIFNRVLAMSPDGRFFVTTSVGSSNRLVVRAMDDVDPRPLPGTEGGRDPSVVTLGSVG